MMLVATLAADEITPATAPIVAHELGAGSVAAIDVGAACTGSIAALAHATAWIEAGRARNVLVIGAEILDALHRLRRSRAPRRCSGTAPARSSSRSTPTGRSGRSCSAATAARRRRSAPRARRACSRWKATRPSCMAVDKLSHEHREVARARRSWRSTDVDLFVYHQANSRILARGGRAAGAAARARVRLHRRARQHERRERAAGARRGRRASARWRRARASCSARSAPVWCGARRSLTWGGS